jgi:hypothetical protein
MLRHLYPITSFLKTLITLDKFLSLNVRSIHTRKATISFSLTLNMDNSKCSGQVGVYIEIDKNIRILNKIIHYYKICHRIIYKFVQFLEFIFQDIYFIFTYL